MFVCADCLITGYLFPAGLKNGAFCALPVNHIAMAYFGIVGAFAKLRTAGTSRNTPAEDAKTVIDLLARGVCPPEIQNKIR